MSLISLPILTGLTQLEQVLYKELDSVAQNAHMLSGAVWVLLLFMFGVPDPLVGAAVLFFVALTAFKEFYLDQRNEIETIRGSNARDFFFYNLGQFFGLILVLIKLNT